MAVLLDYSKFSIDTLQTLGKIHADRFPGNYSAEQLTLIREELKNRIKVAETITFKAKFAESVIANHFMKARKKNDRT